MNSLRKLWASIKRNPVINGFVIALIAQLAHDYLAHEIDWTNILGYIATLLCGVAVREFTVPVSKHEETKAMVSEAIVRLEEQKQAEINAMLDRFEGKGRS